MFNFENLQLYKQYLNTVQKIIDSRFEDQKEFIYCKQGCTHCCKKGTYPLSRIEFEYLSLGFLNLENNVKEEIFAKLYKLKENYINAQPTEEYMHECPFLDENNSCSIYEFRPLICRTFGLLIMTKDEKVHVPFCQDLGLNYCDSFNKETNSFEKELIEKMGYKNEPKAYPLSLKYLMDTSAFEDFDLDFGEIKALAQWL